MSGEWDFMDPASRDVLLSTVREEAAAFFDEAERAGWEAPTACAAWQVRDVVGHLIDVTEGYFVGFDHARTFRSHAKDDVLKRGRHAFDRMMDIADGLSDEEWSSLIVTHPYMGPVPAGFYPEFQLIDYAVHTCYIREGQARRRTCPGTPPTFWCR